MTGRLLVRHFVMKCIMWVGNFSLALSNHFIPMCFQVALFLIIFHTTLKKAGFEYFLDNRLGDV